MKNLHVAVAEAAVVAVADIDAPTGQHTVVVVEL